MSKKGAATSRPDQTRSSAYVSGGQRDQTQYATVALLHQRIKPGLDGAKHELAVARTRRARAPSRDAPRCQRVWQSPGCARDDGTRRSRCAFRTRPARRTQRGDVPGSVLDHVAAQHPDPALERDGAAHGRLLGAGLSGVSYIPAFFGTAVYLYGGSVFLKAGLRELRDRLAGMMTLISLAITVAFGGQCRVRRSGD